MKRSELMALIAKNFKRDFETCNYDALRAMNKKELKEYINRNGGFSKGKIMVNSIEKAQKIEGVPEDAIYIEAELSDESENMNGYVIETDAWAKGLEKYFSDFGGKILLQHNMDEPIGKTLSIEPKDDNGRKYLWANGYARDEYTNKKLSRGLISDISTGHIPLVIVYRNRETNDELSYEDFWIMIDKLVDDLIDEDKTWTEIRTAIQDKIAEYQERHREVQIIEWSTVTIGSNKQAEIKTIKNKFEIIKNEVSEEDQKSTIEPDEKVEDKVEPNNTDTPENKEEAKTDTKTNEEDIKPTENNLENEGGTPEGSNDIPAEPEKVLTAEEKLTAKVEELTAENTTLKNEVEELKTFNNGRKKVVVVNTSDKDVQISEERKQQLLNSCNRLLHKQF